MKYQKVCIGFVFIRYPIESLQQHFHALIIYQKKVTGLQGHLHRAVEKTLQIFKAMIL